MKSSTAALAMALCLGVPFAMSNMTAESNAASYYKKYDEFREYHKHWLGVCPKTNMKSCRAVTYTHTGENGFFLHGRLAVERHAETGKLWISFLDHSANHFVQTLSDRQQRLGDAFRLEREAKTTYTIRFSNGTEKTLTTGVELSKSETYSERTLSDQAQVSELIGHMKSSNYMTVTSEAFGVEGQNTQFYSLVGFQSALGFVERQAQTASVASN